jgi:TATA-box binding protein (TBP) (component of TFIID and TFIIIB)
MSLEDIDELPDIETEDVSMDRYPTKADMKVATRTLICKIGVCMNIKKICEKVIASPGKIEKIKAGNKKDSDSSVAETEDKKAVRKNKKTKKTFYNQVTLIVKPFPERINGINMKLSENGSIQMTGPKTIEEGHQSVANMIKYLYETDPQIFYHKIKTSNQDDSSVGTDSTLDTKIVEENVKEDIIYISPEEIKKIPILSTHCELIIVSFQLPFLIHLNRFNTILKEKYNLLSIFGTSSYPGINTKMTYPYDCTETEHIKKKKRYLCKCRDMSIFTFRTGKVIITGFETIEKIETIFQQYIEMVQKEEQNIRIESKNISSEIHLPKRMEINGRVFEVVHEF